MSEEAGKTVAETTWFRCIKGHRMRAVDGDGNPVDLNMCVCPVCLGRVVSGDLIGMLGFTLAPMDDRRVDVLELIDPEAAE